MENVLYLAMTAAEFQENEGFPGPMAWMACHFSPYGTGLSNLPQRLPEGSLLMVNDRTPVFGHSPERIARQVAEAVSQLGCSGVLLDFQREWEPLTQAIADAIAALDCPVGITPPYAGAGKCGVFLPPPPLTVPLEEHLAPWRDRPIWLEAATEAVCIRVDAGGNRQLPPADSALPYPHKDEKLHCRYRTEVQAQHIDFHLCRDGEMLGALMGQAAALGVQRFVGLYQQLGQAGSPFWGVADLSDDLFRQDPG